MTEVEPLPFAKLFGSTGDQVLVLYTEGEDEESECDVLTIHVQPRGLGVCKIRVVSHPGEAERAAFRAKFDALDEQTARSHARAIYTLAGEVSS